jgi:hypothetical protein
MIKKLFFLTMGVVMTFTFASALFAEDTGDERKGKYAYRNVYKACNQRGEVDSPKPPLSPDSMTQAQWKRLFDKKKFEKFGCAEEWNKLSEQDLLNIYTYLHAHAADSPSPAKCK